MAEKVAVTARLMPNFRLATPFNLGITNRYAMAAATNNHQAVLFAVNNTGTVNYIYPDAASDTGWSCTDLGFGGKARFVTAGTNKDGSITVYVVDYQNQVYVYNNQQQKAGWRQIPLPGEYLINGGIMTGNGFEGELFVVLLCNDAISLMPTYFYLPYNTHSWNSFGFGVKDTPFYAWCPAAMLAEYNPEWKYACGVYTSQGDINDGNGNSVSGVTGVVTGNFYSPEIIGNFPLVTSARSSKGYDEPFVADDKGGLFYLYTTPSNPRFYQGHGLAGEIKLKQIVGGQSAPELMEVFALSTDGYLYHVRQLPTKNGWSNFTRLSSSYQFINIVAVHNPDGYTDLFGVTTANTLLHIWQDPVTLEWRFNEIEFGTGQQVEEVKTYNIQVTVFDNNDVPSAGAIVALYADSPVMVQVNGRYAYLDETITCEGTSNSAGVVEISMLADGLGATDLYISTPFMPVGDRIALKPAGSVQHRLLDLDDDGNDLMNASYTNEQGNVQYLVQNNDYRTEDYLKPVSQSIKAAMQLVPDTYNNDQYNGVFHRKTNPFVAHYIPGYDKNKPSTLTAIESYRGWRLDVVGDKLAFSWVTPEEAAFHFEANSALPQFGQLRGLGIDVDWGDVFADIKNGIAQLSDVVVNAVTNGIRVSLTFVINGIKNVFDTIINHAEQLFDIVEEVFKQVAVAFEDLYKWLTVLFAWKDIRRTQSVIAYSIDELFKFQKTALQHIESQASNFFQNVQNTVNDAFNSMVANPLLQQSMLQVKQSYVVPAVTDEADHNNVLSAFLTNATNAKVVNARLANSAEIQNTIQQIVTLLTSEATSFQTTAAFNAAMAHFSAATSNSDQFLENSLLGLMNVLQGVSNFAIGLADTIVQTLIDAILTLLDIMEAMLNEEWDIPLVSGLFSLACPGKPLNLKNLLALILAIPSTIIYKLVYNSAPFPDDQNITDFRNLFNERALAADAGIANGTTATGRIGLYDPATLQVAKTMFGIINSLSAWLSGTFNTCVDSLPPGSEQADTTFIKVLSKGTFTLGLVSQLTAIPWPFKTDGLPPVPFYNGTASEFENLIWVLQWAGIGIDGIYLLADGHLTRSDEDAGAVISSVFGSIYLGLFIALAVWENNSDPKKTAQNLIGGIPGCAKFCRVNALVESSLGISLVALAATDAIGYFTSGTLGFIGCLQPAAQRNQVVLA